MHALRPAETVIDAGFSVDVPAVPNRSRVTLTESWSAGGIPAGTENVAVAVAVAGGVAVEGATLIAGTIAGGVCAPAVPEPTIARIAVAIAVAIARIAVPAMRRMLAVVSVGQSSR